jgi:hypothetical protein
MNLLSDIVGFMEVEVTTATDFGLYPTPITTATGP